MLPPLTKQFTCADAGDAAKHISMKRNRRDIRPLRS
jgi:hypothetical protein